MAKHEETNFEFSGDHREVSFSVGCACGWYADGSGQPGSDTPEVFARALASDMLADHIADAERVECAYCGADVRGPAREDEHPPEAADDGAWAALAAEHADGCEWVETRAHRR